jgi:tetratricopeptide (TPR) repeat protein
LLKWILLLFATTQALLALEISINSAIEDHKHYSILHLREKNNFACEEIVDDFSRVKKIICAFPTKPLKNVKNIQNDFFKVETFVKNKMYFIVIYPFKKIKLFPVIFDMTQEDSVYNADVSLAKHWMIVGYFDKLPLIHKDEKSEIGINFPFYLDKDKLPYVGGLDIKGNPIHIKKVGDVTDYLKVKKYFNAKKYDICLETIDSILDRYPNTLFKAELLYYKIKVYNEIKDYDNVIDSSKLFLREYSSDENVAEVLSLIAKAYAQIGQIGDADYFFDRLFSEHAKSLYTQWGYIYKGHQSEEGGGNSVAIKFYKRALDETTNLDLAVNAAFDLASINLSLSMKESIKYMNKILKAKPSFLATRLKKSMEIMQSYAEMQHYLVAAQMAKALLDNIKKNHDEYESILKDRALWLTHTPQKKEALLALNEYLEHYSDGEYIDEIQIAKDSLFFDQKDLNASVKMQEYDKLIEEYAGDSIGDRAIYEKAKLLLAEKRYKELLDFQSTLLGLDKEQYKDIDEIIKKAAIGAMDMALKKKECHSVLAIATDYNITLSNSWDDGIYECAMKGGDYQLSKSIASKNFKSKDLNLRKKWLYRYIKVDFATGNYSDVLSASKDLIALMGDNDLEYKDVYRYLFDTYQRLEKNDEMINAIAKIQEVYGLDYRDLDRYAAMVSLGSQLNDDMLVIKYAKEALKIQKRSKSYPQSPFLEFTLYQSYMNIQEYDKALETIKLLDKVTLSKTQRARQKYLLGTLYTKLWRNEEALDAFNDAIKADPQSAWAELAKSAKEI